MNSEAQYIDLYQQARNIIFSHSPEALNSLRDKAFEDFRRLGFPSRKVEEYRYTDMEALFEPDYGINLNRIDIPVNPYDVFRCDVPNLSTSLYFVVNDAFYDKALPKASLPEGVTVCSLSRIAEEQPEILKRYYGQLADTGADAVTALNTMLSQDGLFVHVGRNIKVERTIQVINILKTPQWLPGKEHGDDEEWNKALMANRRVLIVMEEGAEAHFLFCDHAADDRHFLTTQVTEAFVGERATLELNCLEETHSKNARVSNVYIRQEADSNVSHNVITLHNGITRNPLILTLEGKGAQCSCNGCVIADKAQHVDNNTLIDHRATHCTSSELYKYVLDENATGAFAGKVLVRPEAQKTVSEERNQNLLITREARMYTQPVLEIYADDVKCSHGSTVGQLNDEALFYMRQRGISLKEARLLLEFAFVNEVIDKIHLEPLRNRLHYLVEKRFRGELNKCKGCMLCK
ncbi:MAG: Fe-S cluster assembly protein SufD [Prevotella sp.]|nr:Fe-S cluster assembly protein SufD [Prevotella sp.]